jgi:hypothetical protein
VFDTHVRIEGGESSRSVPIKWKTGWMVEVSDTGRGKSFLQTRPYGLFTFPPPPPTFILFIPVHVYINNSNALFFIKIHVSMNISQHISSLIFTAIIR